LTFNLRFYFITKNKTIDTTKKAAAIIHVYLPSIASRVLPLYFPKNVSAPPAIEPESPALFPDCKSTTIISAIAKRSSKTVRIIFRHCD